jgi:hypothetical protein
MSILLLIIYFIIILLLKVLFTYHFPQILFLKLNQLLENQLKMKSFQFIFSHKENIPLKRRLPNRSRLSLSIRFQILNLQSFDGLRLPPAPLSLNNRRQK